MDFYKAVRPKNDQLVSSNPDLPPELVLTYAHGLWTWPRVGGIFVLSSTNIRMHMCQLWAVDAVNPRQIDTMVAPFYLKYMAGVAETFWAGPGGLDSRFVVATGYYFGWVADAVLLKERVL
ncbi:MAG: hypothetical protein A2W25_12120 [candidate division Zixibacteria bacterium RBG_16_53_22]|nr:MAG: hypothetical protein A2W25_12120 [candidate division Zixibacteria bacterium RBG_16_53_22]